MTAFSVSGLTQSSVLYLYSTRTEIQIDPVYQRMGEVWPREKRQLLIDSVLNGFDIPKIYFHELIGQTHTKYKYAIVDGRQRLESIWAFINGDFPLSDEFEYLADSNVKAAGLTYRELGQKYPRLKAFFDATTLSVIVIRTQDTDLIEDMFSRLNEAVPLNAAEKRNAFGGPLPGAIRAVAALPFFTKRIAISNRRYQHRELAAKFLYLTHANQVADTKKIYLDSFVRSFKAIPMSKVLPLVRTVKTILFRMDKVFVKEDDLLKSAGMIVLYFLLFKEAMENDWVDDISRSTLERFEKQRRDNRRVAEQDITKADYDLLEFDRLTQTPNDAYAIKIRLTTMKKHLGLNT
jgi:hypothetical protein